MSQDFFLKQTYNFVYKTNKFKSNFITLAESYDMVCENEEKIPFAVDDVKLEVVPWTVEQQFLFNLTAKNPTKDEQDKEVVGAGESKTGAGPGELAAASVVSGITDIEGTTNLISGQGQSFDIAWPSRKHPKYKFEVKFDIGDGARINKYGANFCGHILRETKDILNKIYEEYSLLDKKDRRTIDLNIIDQLSVSPEIDWTLEKYIKDYFIERLNRGELNFRVIFKGNKFNKTREGFNPLLQLETLIEILENLSQKDKEEHNTDTEKDSPRLTAVKDIFTKYYGSSSDKNNTLNNRLDQEAENIDRKLIKVKKELTGEKISNVIEFYKHIKKFKLKNKLDKIKEELSDMSNLTNLYPSDITGLFLVYKNGYRYLPKNVISKYTKISTITMGKVKVTFKKPENET